MQGGHLVNMSQSGLLKIIALFVTSYCSSGCGYTVMRDLEREAIQAEWAAIDSTHFLPDLTISDVTYEHRYQPGPQNVVDPIDSRGFHAVTFHLTIENVGNADFHAPYTIIFIKDAPQPWETNTFYGMEFNKHADTISIAGKQVVDLFNEYPFLESHYHFVIVTNPIIQHEVVEELNHHTHALPIPKVRESRYDNNSTSVDLPALEALLHGAQHGK